MDVRASRVLTRSTAPGYLLPIAEAREHLRIDGDYDDAYLESLAAVAAATLDGPDGMIGKALLSQGWTLTQPRLLAKDRLELPVVPFASLASIKYYDTDNTQQTASLSDFVVFGNEDWAYVEPVSSWPAMYDRPDAIEVIWTAGYGVLSDVPSNILHAAKLLVAHWYEHREAVKLGATPVELPLAVESLVNISRRGWVRS